MYLPSQITKGKTEKIGDTLFIDGVPYTECGICGTIIKKFDGLRQVKAGRDKISVEVKEYKVQVGRWIGIPDSTVDNDGVENIEMKMRPIIRSVPACVDCFNLQQDQREMEKHLERTVPGYKMRLVMFKG